MRYGRPCSAGRPPEQSPAEQDLLLIPLDETDAVRTTSNPVPGELTFCLDALPADVQTVLPASQASLGRCAAETIGQGEIDDGASNGARHGR